MSLVSNYIKATDGLFYRNPTLEGKDWFVCFDDDDPEEIVIKTSSKKTPQEILKEIGIEYDKLSYHQTCGRCFGKGFKFYDAKSYFFNLKNRIDPKFITKHDGIVKSKDEIFQGVISDF